MIIYKIFREVEWETLSRMGQTSGTPIDLVDGYIHFSTAAQVKETAKKHFSDDINLILAKCDSTVFGDNLKWETSRGGALFPHLYCNLKLTDITSFEPLLQKNGKHLFPKELE